jgi:putative transposase
MSRLPRIAVPELPHHVTHRGNRKADIFRDDIDRQVYIKLLAANCNEYSVRIWAWCLMTNHVHLIVVPKEENSLSKAFQRTHGDFASYFNARYLKTGHLWQGRFKASLLDGRVRPLIADCGQTRYFRTTSRCWEKYPIGAHGLPI